MIRRTRDWPVLCLVILATPPATLIFKCEKSSFWNSGACITALSCVEMRRSSSAMRASMLAERLSEMVTVPAMTSRTSSPMMSLARACSTSVLATLLRATMS